MQDRPLRKASRGVKTLTWHDAWSPIHEEVGEFKATCEKAWNHSVISENDFKSPMKAELQGFLMSQNFYEVEYNDALQCFEISHVNEEVWQEKAMNEQLPKVKTLREDLEDIGEKVQLELAVSDRPALLELALCFPDEYRIVHERKETWSFAECTDVKQTVLSPMKHLQEDTLQTMRAIRIETSELPNSVICCEKILIAEPDDPIFFAFCSILDDGAELQWISYETRENTLCQILCRNPFEWKAQTGAVSATIAGCPSNLDGGAGRKNGVQICFFCKEPLRNKVGEEHLIEPEEFEHVDIPVFVPGQQPEEEVDAPFVLPLEADERVLTSIQRRYEQRPVNLIFFGYDGRTTERRDEQVDVLNPENVAEALRQCWSDKDAYVITPWLVLAQPDELVNEGVSFVVVLQYMFALERVVPAGQVITLTVLNMQHSVFGEAPNLITVFRGASMSSRITLQEVFEKHDLTNLCRPRGRRHCSLECDLQSDYVLLDAETSCAVDNGALIRANIGPWNAAVEMLRNFCGAESLVEDINKVFTEKGALKLHIHMHGHRLVPLGVRKATIEVGSALSFNTIGEHITRSWHSQPIDRAKIFRARALESMQDDELQLHLLLGFDLRPGNALILAVGDLQMQECETLEGPELLAPHHWDLGLANQAFSNPLREGQYEILAVSNDMPSFPIQSGSVFYYIHVDGRDDDAMNLVQMSSNLESEQEPSRCCHERMADAHPVPAVEESCTTLQLFPYLESSLPYDVGQPVPEPNVTDFIHACAQIELASFIPNEVFDTLKPISKAFLETCSPFQHVAEEYHIYTDGAACAQKVDGHVFREASWASAIFRVSGRERDFLGWLGGLVSTDPNEKLHIGATNKTAMDAERSAVFWSLAWCLSLPPQCRVFIHTDNQAACFGAAGTWQINLKSELAVRMRELAAYVGQHVSLTFEHVKAHSLQPQNEIADTLAAQIAEDTQCLRHRKKRRDHQVAAFKEYKKLWFLSNQGASLPRLDSDDRVLDLELSESKAKPRLLRPDSSREQAPDCASASIDVNCATYNVLTLKPYEKDEDAHKDSAYFGKSAYLQNQMKDCGLAVLGVQEGRSRESGIFESHQAIRLVAAGTEARTHGVELWLSKQQAFGTLNKKRLFVERKRLCVRFSSPTVLFVSYSLKKCRLAFVVCHAPQTGQDEEYRAKWWKDLSGLLDQIRPDEHLILLGDFNAKLPEPCQPHVGDLVCNKKNGNTKFMMELLQQKNLFVPSTFRSLHHGPSETWRHSSGSMSRLDYFLIRKEQWSYIASSSLIRLDAGNRDFVDEKIALWLGFRRMRGQSLCNTKTSVVLPHLVTCYSVMSLRRTAKDLKEAIKTARALFVEKVSQNANSSNTAQIFAELRKLGVNGKQRKQGITPLPIWTDEKGRPAADVAERANLWKLRCSALESGIFATTEQLVERAESQRHERCRPLEAPSLNDMPSLTQIEAKLRVVKKGKAAGNDLLRSELCSLGAAPLAKHVHALTAKFVTFLEEPIQWKGGTLISAYKHSGRMDDVKSYRSLLLSDHLGKSMRSWVRERFRSLYTENSAPTHFAGKLGGNPSHASSLARA